MKITVLIRLVLVAVQHHDLDFLSVVNVKAGPNE